MLLTIRAIIILLAFLGILAFFSKSDIIGKVYAVVLKFMWLSKYILILKK